MDRIATVERLDVRPLCMKRKSKFLLIAACVEITVGSVVWPGCVNIPLPASRKPISELRKSDFIARKLPKTRFEIQSILGAPDAYVDDLRVACYDINELNRRRLWLLFAIIPIGAPKDPTRTETVMILYDKGDNYVRSGAYERAGTFKSAAQEWLNGKKRDIIHTYSFSIMPSPLLIAPVR